MIFALQTIMTSYEEDVFSDIEFFDSYEKAEKRFNSYKESFKSSTNYKENGNEDEHTIKGERKIFYYCSDEGEEYQLEIIPVENIQ